MQPNLWQLLSCTGEVGCREGSISYLDKFYQPFLYHVWFLLELDLKKTPLWNFEIWAVCVLLQPTFFFHIKALMGEVNPNFSKCYRKNWLLCTSINWSSNLVNSAPCKFSLIWCKVVCNNNISVLIYLIPLTPYHSVPTFANSNMLTIFNTFPNMIFQWRTNIVSSS